MNNTYVALVCRHSQQDEAVCILGKVNIRNRLHIASSKESHADRQRSGHSIVSESWSTCHPRMCCHTWAILKIYVLLVFFKTNPKALNSGVAEKAI